MPHDVPPPHVQGLPPRHAVIHSVEQLPRSVTEQVRHPGALEHRWLAATVLAAGVLLAAAWAVAAIRWRRRGLGPGHALPRRIGLSTAVALLLVTGGLLGVNSYVGYVPDMGSLETLIAGDGHAGSGGHHVALAVRPNPAYSQIVQEMIGAPELGIGPQRTFVYLPPGYDEPANADVRYPVVYLIHGYPGTASDWLRAGRARQAMDLLLARHYVQPAIMVFPNANGGWLRDTECLNAVHGQQLETYLTRTVVRAIDSRFRTIPNRSGRAIGGMSSGAYCALNLGLRHLDTFSVILASEPYGEPGKRVLTTMLDGNRRLYLQNCPSWYVPTMRFSHPVSVFLDAGTDDPGTVGTATALAKEFAARGQYVAVRLGPGMGHTWMEARVELPYSLVFAGKHLAPPVLHRPVRRA
jgi:enterochelin esterase-like enzyme